RARGGPQARDRLRRAPGLSARLRRARRRAGAARVADEGRRPQHAYLEADREAPKATAMIHAVIFDLWETLVDWPLEQAAVFRRDLAERAGLPLDEVERRMSDHYLVTQTHPLASVYRLLGVPENDVEAHVGARVELTRRLLRPRVGVVETLAELRRRGLRVGLISMCSEDVPVAWPDTALARLF